MKNIYAKGGEQNVFGFCSLQVPGAIVLTIQTGDSDFFSVYLSIKTSIMTAQEPVSTFARIVDKLRVMDEDELEHAYLKLFQQGLEDEWEEITGELNFGDATDEDIVTAIQKNRYKHEA